MSNKGSPEFVLDTSALVTAYRYWYAPKSAPNFWKEMKNGAARGTLVAPIHVFYELERVLDTGEEDGLFKMAKVDMKKMFVEPPSNCQILVSEILKSIDSNLQWNHQEIADPWCIALAESLGIPLVHQEAKPKNTAAQNIYSICSARSVAHMQVYGLVNLKEWRL